MSKNFTSKVNGTKGICPAGEKAAAGYMAAGRIPVFSCEGACIRGEIARQAANMVAREEPYARACHGETLTVPHSSIARWVRGAEKVILIDGCFLRCHGRLLENLISDDRLIQFDALKHYQKYKDVVEIDAVPEAERLDTARDIASWVLECMA